MKPFLDENFLLESDPARELYHDYASIMPVIDYHNHLPPDQIAGNHQFANITQAWLYGDHYKWRAMRANGIKEDFITGPASDVDKFSQWAATVPYTLRNPLYHWTHLELQRYFDCHKILSPDTATGIYQECSEKLRTNEYSVKNLLLKMNVKVLCTTDDPVDNLEHHRKIAESGYEIKVLPAFRPDKAMNVEVPSLFNAYLEKLESSSGVSIAHFNDYLDALKKRHDYFAQMGCSVSDHGLENMYAEDFTDSQIRSIFDRIRTGKELSALEKRQFQSAMLLYFARWDCEKGWVQQFHLGALRNNNHRMLSTLGADTGCDSIGDFEQAGPLSRFLDSLDKNNQLAKTILYNLNPANNELFATMAGNFNDGSVVNKVQWGSAWWFLDQKDGMIQQLNTLSNMGLLSRFVGMLTDSRSFLSFPRHEYFRRILCNLLGADIENGELPHDIKWIGQVVQDICYNNAKNYFGW